MAIGTLFGSNPESSGLYGIATGTGNNPTVISQTYFEWFIFTTSAGTPATPTGGSWDFNTNTGTAPAGWSNFISGVPLNSLWFSVAFVDSRNPTVITWTNPGLLSSQSIYATAYADVFTGNGSTVAWTLTQDPVVVNNTDVSINGVTQVPGTDYTLSGTTLTTTTAAPLNAVILVKYRQALPLSYYGAASNVQFTPVGALTATNVQAAITEVVTDLALSSGSSTVGFLQAGTGAVATTVQAKLRESVSVLDFGADNTGATNCSTQVASAYAYAITNGGELYFPPGTYLGQFVFSGEAPVRGAGIRRTVLKPSNTASYCVRLYGIGGDANLGATISNLSITSTTKTGKGLECGDRAFTSGCSNALIERLEISGFEENITLSMCLSSTFRQVYSYGGVYGIAFDGEANVTTLHFDSCRFRLNDYGIYARTGLNVIWTNCNSESNVLVNLWLRTGLTNGPAEWIFNTCWFENITGSSGSRYCIFLDMLSAIAATKPMNVRFNYCTISAPQTIPDVRADRAQDVIFDHCYFSSTPDAFTSAKFSYATGTDAVRIRLLNCGQITAFPTVAMYASFPALTINVNGVFGFIYEFYNTLNELITNNNPVATYQTGTFTPVIIGTTTAGAGTYGNQVGRYTKIANRVFFNLRLTWSAHTGTGNMNVSGLPFTILSASDLGSVAIYADAIALTAANYMMARLENGSTQIVLRQTPTGTIGLSAVPLDTAGTLVISGQYEVA